MVEEINAGDQPPVEKNKGGRPFGSMNARSRSIAGMIREEFEERGTSLIAELVDLAMTCKDPAVRSKTLLGLSRYVYPTLTAVAVRNDSAPQTAFVLDLGGKGVIEVKPEQLDTKVDTEEPETD